MLQQIGCLTALTSPLLRPIEWYVLRHHPKPRTWCLVSSTERTALNFSVNAYGDLSSSKHVNVVTVCFAATDVYFSFTIFTPHRYSLRFIRILTDTLSVTHKYFTITTCLGVPTTLYPHYCRHASTQDCSHGRAWTYDPLIRTCKGTRTHKWHRPIIFITTNRLYRLAIQVNSSQWITLYTVRCSNQLSYVRMFKKAVLYNPTANRSNWRFGKG